MSRLSYADMIAEVAEHLAIHDVHGYSQPNRGGDGTVETVTLSDGTEVQAHGADYDCSEMARMCCAAAGVLDWDYWDSYMWTGNADDVLVAHDFVRYAFSPSQVKRGDVLWVKGHMGIALGGGLQADAHGDEYGGISGPNVGDQTGREVEIRDLKTYWTYMYRYAGPPRPEPDPEPETITIEEAEDMYIIRPDGKPWLELVCGTRHGRINDEAEAEAVREAYAAAHAGAAIPQFELGAPEDPKAQRLFDVLGRMA